MNPYGAVVQEHFRNPRNYGSLDAPDIRHEEVNPLCGDRIRIEMNIGSDQTVLEVRFQGDLCMIGKAASSLLTEMIAGLNVGSVTAFPEGRLLDAIGIPVPPARLKCALLPLVALRAGIDTWRTSRSEE